MCEDHCIGDGGAHRQAMRIPDGNPRAEPALSLLPHPQRDVKADNAAFAGCELARYQPRPDSHLDDRSVRGRPRRDRGRGRLRSGVTAAADVAAVGDAVERHRPSRAWSSHLDTPISPTS